MSPFHEDSEIFYFELSDISHLIGPQSHLSELSGSPSTEPGDPTPPPMSKAAASPPITHYSYEHLRDLTQPDLYTSQKAELVHSQIQDAKQNHIPSPVTVSAPSEATSESDGRRSHDGHNEELHGLDER
ncbi:hypothetical protein NW755_014832 [Fusarium falciforme]|uniref:Uncharacterized protein n=1 Tax=Fusarium falciforme TaxID=195108 RepID=A0A9W8QTF6_9HYPO|nr:hypothetical protein NW755_014832 [Fusarium falciforme]